MSRGIDDAVWDLCVCVFVVNFGLGFGLCVEAVFNVHVARFHPDSTCVAGQRKPRIIITVIE